jgi:hypothetical protein
MENTTIKLHNRVVKTAELDDLTITKAGLWKPIVKVATQDSTLLILLPLNVKNVIQAKRKEPRPKVIAQIA